MAARKTPSKDVYQAAQKKAKAKTKAMQSEEMAATATESLDEPIEETTESEEGFKVAFADMGINELNSAVSELDAQIEYLQRERNLIMRTIDAKLVVDKQEQATNQQNITAALERSKETAYARQQKRLAIQRVGSPLDNFLKSRPSLTRRRQM